MESRPLDRTVRTRAICTLAAVILVLILEKAGAECERHRFDTLAAWPEFVTDIVKLQLLILLPVGNSRYRFVFAIRYGNVDYQFASTHIPPPHDFRAPVDAEDMSKVHHVNLPFMRQALQPTDQVPLDPNDYAFCERASRVIRRIGFDNVILHPEHSVVQFQIYDFLGWDTGWRYVYYFSPSDALPEDFTYTQQLNANWCFARKPRFSD